MNLEELMGTIEDHRFAAEANLAIGSRAFHSGIRTHCVIHQLLEHMKEPNVPEIILKRTVELAKRPVPTPFENPFDTALAAYLTALDLNSPELLRHAAEAVSKAPNCWWATEMSLRFLARSQQGQMPLAIFQPGANANTLGMNTDQLSNLSPTYPALRARGRGLSGHRRRRHSGRLAVA